MDFADVNFGITYESGPFEFEEFPRTAEPVYILGRDYSALHELEELKDDIKSRLWITYRRNFQNIGGTGPSSDQGWGCMLRCGQMMLAQCLVLRHLGRDWRWKQDMIDETYWRLLRMFEDKKMATYSIHQIASMGEAEGKAIGQWFGPNTIAQVLKRISVYDDWSNIAIHVALDNVVILDDIRTLCKSKNRSKCKKKISNSDKPELEVEQFSCFVNEKLPNQTLTETWTWKPLLLIIPLRLGLTDINPIYFESLKKCFKLKQSVGIIGGKPNHAHWFIGFVDKELIYLDPHTTQNIVDLDDRRASDVSYHCTTPPSRMSFSKLDPSIALGFYCATENEFEELCETFTLPDKSCQSMFEVRKDAPWPYTESATTTVYTDSKRGNSLSDFAVYDSKQSTGGCDDEEFEII